MATMEERVSYQEARMEDISKAIVRLEGAIAALDTKMDKRFDRVEDRFFWVIGVQFGILIAIVAGLFGVVSRLITPA